MQPTVRLARAASPQANPAPPDWTGGADVPAEVQQGVDRWLEDLRNAPREPGELMGVVYEQYADGSTRVLAAPGTTTPDLPPDGPNIPNDAVVNNRVVIYADGIHQRISTQQDQIHRLLQADPHDPKDGVNVGQPVIGVHEAVGKSALDDGTRIAADLAYTKAVQGRYMPLAWVRKAAYRADPTVKSVHDEIRQSLEAGRDVLLCMHSGGGAISALALNLLAHENHGKWKNAIRDHVRVLALSTAAAARDFELAGVKPENLYYTGSRQDPVHNIMHHFIHPYNFLGNFPFIGTAIADGLKAAMDPKFGPYHSPDYILWANARGGHSRIQDFIDGAPGGNYVLP
jgi:hypothetical protein